MKSKQNIAVLGAGLMGHGIALSFAKFGHKVRVYDPFSEHLKTLHSRVKESLEAIQTDEHSTQKTLANIEADGSLVEAVANAFLIIEAGPEKLETKHKIFLEAEAVAGKDCYIASNTSVIPIAKITSVLKNKSRALGTHWWNPPHIIPLVEVIRTEWTSENAMKDVVSCLSGIDKIAVRVNKDVPGFIGNRLQHALWREAISLVENGVCSAEAVDNVVKASFGRRLAVLGPLENVDLIGTELTVDIHENILFDLENSANPSPYLKKLVADGRLGMKSGEGFRRWSSNDAHKVKNRLSKYLVKLEKILE